MKHYSHIVLIVLIGLIGLGCSKQAILEVSQKALTFEAFTDDAQRVDISSTSEWKAYSSASWCKLVTFNTHGVTTAYVDIKCDANTELIERTCTVTITSEALSSQITITQTGRQGVVVKQTSYNVSSDEQDVSVEIDYNTSYSVRIDDNDISWVSFVSGTRAVQSTNLVFRVKRNTNNEGRTADILIYPQYSASPIHVLINQAKGKVNEESANCFLITSSGNHSFKALYKGRTFEPIGSPKSAKVIWESFNDDTAVYEGSLISSCHYNEGTGSIEYSINPDVKSGNAIIAAFSGDNGTGRILWSWHIWYIEGYDAADSAVKYPSGKYFMDRNLGALSAEESNPKANGLFYQWGRKDPFPGKAYSDRTQPISTSAENPVLNKFASSQEYQNDIEYSVSNPLTFICNWNETKNGELWGGEIGLYNPCPKGWTIPKGIEDKWSQYDKGDWNGISNENFDKLTSRIGGVYLKYSQNGEKISWYPSSGRILKEDGMIEWFGNQSFFFWSHRMDYAFSGTITKASGGSYYLISFSEYTQDNKDANPAYGFSVRCVRE